MSEYHEVMFFGLIAVFFLTEIAWRKTMKGKAKYRQQRRQNERQAAKASHVVHDDYGRTYLAYSRADAIYIRDTVGGRIEANEE